MASLARVSGSNGAKSLLLWGGLVVVFGAFAGYGYLSNQYFKDNAINPDTGCFAYAATPATVFVLDDATDKLAGDQPRRWRASVSDTLASLPPGARIAFADIGLTAPTEVTFKPSLCVPPVGNAARQKALRQQFGDELAGVQRRLEAASTTPHSAVAGTILAAALDPSVISVARKTFLIESDLLENSSPQTTAYGRKTLVLPTFNGTPFKGITMRFVVLRNTRDARRQTPELVQTWIAWARAGGAVVEVDAPWLGFVAAPAAVVGDQP